VRCMLDARRNQAIVDISLRHRCCPLVSHFVYASYSRQRWNWVTFCDPVTRESSDLETLFYNELQMSTYV